MLNEVRAERAAKLVEIETLVKAGESREWTPEESAKYDELKAAHDALDERLKALEAMVMPAEEAAAPIEEKSAPKAAVAEGREYVTSRRKAMNAPGFVRDYDDRQAKRDSDLAFRGWVLGPDASDSHREAAQRSGLNLKGSLFVKRGTQLSAEERAQSTTGSAGGYTIPQGFLAALERKMLQFNTLRSIATVISTTTGNSMPMPTADDTSNTGALVSENTATTATDVTLAQITFGAYTYKTVVTSSNELLQDTGLDLPTIIGEIMGERIGRSEAAAFATGTGSSQPQGVTVGSSAGVTTASSTAITINEILGLINSVDAAYQPTSSFMLHQTVWTYLLKLQDGQGRNLIPINYGDGIAPKIWGYPVYINNNMSSAITTGLITALFGDFSKFYIRDAGPLEVKRSEEFLFTSNATAFLAVGRRDSKVIQSAAIKRLTQL